MVSIQWRTQGVGGGLGGLEPPPPPTKRVPEKKGQKEEGKKGERERGGRRKVANVFFPALFILCHWNFFLLSAKIILL